MKVILRGVHLTLTDAIKQHVQTHLVEHLQRLHDSEDTELEIHLRDTNGTKGGLDKECGVTLRFPHGHPIHVTEASEDIYKSIDLARDRVENSAKRLLERSHDKRHQNTPSDLHSLE